MSEELQFSLIWMCVLVFNYLFCYKSCQLYLLVWFYYCQTAPGLMKHSLMIEMFLFFFFLAGLAVKELK